MTQVVSVYGAVCQSHMSVYQTNHVPCSIQHYSCESVLLTVLGSLANLRVGFVDWSLVLVITGPDFHDCEHHMQLKYSYSQLCWTARE